MGGFILGALRFVAEVGTKAGWLTWEPLTAYARINFLHFAIILFAISCALLVTVSLATAPPAAANLKIFEISHNDVRQGSKTEHRRNVIMSIVLVLTILAMWFYFSPVFFR